MTLGFIGLGVVGGAVAKAFATKFPIVGYDIKAPDHRDLLFTADMIFLSLPTATVNGKQDQTALQGTCKWLADNKYSGQVIVKSTVVPGTCDQLKRDFGLRIVHNPEFLTAKTPYEDFMNQSEVLLSGDQQDTYPVGAAYLELLAGYPLISVATDFKVTECAKYTHNLFLATKVGFLNEMYKVCEKVGVPYNQVISMALTQGKIGENHTKVPNDGQFGFGGMCFPKDIQALLTWAQECGLTLEQMNATNEANLKIRPETKC